MTMVRVEQSSVAAPAAFSFNAQWTASGGGNTAFSDVYGSPTGTGTYAYTTNNNAVCTITIAGGNSKTGALIGCLMRHDSATNIHVQLDSLPSFTWRQKLPDGTPAAQQYYWYQATSIPISWADTDPTGTSTHTITITTDAANDGMCVVDFIDLFDTTNTMVAGRLLNVGMSIPWGFNPVAVSGRYDTPLRNIGDNLATMLGMTVVNQAVPGEDLINGGNVANRNLRFWSNDYTPGPGWQRLQNTGFSTANHTWANGSGATGAPYSITNASQWHEQRPEKALLMHGRNDLGYVGLYESPAADNAANGASALSQKQLLSATANLTGGSWTLTRGANVTASMGYLIDAATITTALHNASIPFSCWYTTTKSEAGQSRLATNATTGYTLIADVPGTQPSNITLTGQTGITGGTLTLAAPNPAGRAATLAPAGYAMAALKQRTLEACWRMNLNSPQTTIYLVGMCYDYAYDSGLGTTLAYKRVDDVLIAVAGDPTVKNTYFISTWRALMDFDATRNSGTTNAYNNMSIDGTHLTTAGSAVIAQTIRDGILRTQQRAPTMVR